MSFKYCYHSNDFCFFKTRPHRYIRELLSDFQYLQQVMHTHGFCTCFEYAWIRANPKYANLEVEEHEFIEMALNAGFLFKGRVTKYKYTLGRHTGMVFLDPNVGDILEEFFPDKYRDTFEYTKTPRSGHMFFGLLGYLYPEVKMSTNDRFKVCYELALDKVMSQIDDYEVASVSTVVSELPKTTSAGFVAIRTEGARRTKEVILPQIIREYYSMVDSVKKGKEFENYIMFAMRGHLSKKTQLKTRPIWMQSAETIIAEARFSHGLYKQFESKRFFRERMIHGIGSMKKLRHFLLRNSHFHFCNTDISGWDAYRAVFNHRRFYDLLKDKIIMGSIDSKLYDYICYNSNIYGRVIFPSGATFQTNGGLKSGSRWTLAQNSLLNMINSYTALYMMNIEEKYDCGGISFLGDDFCILTKVPFDIKKFGSLLTKYFGLVVKPEKCFVVMPYKDRKFLGYELRGGFLIKPNKELWPGVLYTEHYFKRDYESITKSFTRLFSYLILGGFSNHEYVEFFYLFLGKYGNWLDKVEYIFDDRALRMTRVLKDIYNVQISKFNSETFKKFSFLATKYVLLYDYDLILVNTEISVF